MSVRIVSLAVLAFFLAGCKVVITAPEGSSVTSESGTYSCPGDGCVIEVNDLFLALFGCLHSHLASLLQESKEGYLTFQVLQPCGPWGRASSGWALTTPPGLTWSPELGASMDGEKW